MSHLIENVAELEELAENFNNCSKFEWPLVLFNGFAYEFKVWKMFS